MKQMRLVSLNLPVDLIAAISHAARSSGQTPQDLVRNTLRQTFAAPAEEEAVPEPKPDAPPPFAVHLAFAEAYGWLDLQSRLRAAGFVLRLGDDDVLALHDWPADRRLMDSTALGQPLADLTLRFRAPFPGQVASRPAPRKTWVRDGTRAA